MQRITRVLVLGCAAVALAACSHKDKNAPLAYVPADTPYLVANLKPLTDDARAALMPASTSSIVRANQVTRLRQMAQMLGDEPGNADLAHLISAFADSMDGKTYAQMEAEAGINPDGLFAIYGLGLSPVVRGQLSDPAKFHAYIAKLEKAYGHSFDESTIGKVAYQHAAIGDSNLQVIVATHDKQFVAAVLPVHADKQLRLALGLDRPEHSAQESGLLKKLADADGYGPYSIGYLDTTRLPALIAGANDPLLKALLSAATDEHPAKWNAVLPASCRNDLDRIAARVPLISFGYTKLEPKERIQQVDIQLAPDIVKAFRHVGTDVPGLGHNASSNALADVALALPITTMRDFWLNQAETVKNKPFTCPALTSLNKLAVEAGAYLPRLSMPPLGEWRGLRLVLDQLDMSDTGKTPSFKARLLIASQNPDGMMNTAKALVPALSQLKITDNGEPVALPDQTTSRANLHEPVWVAMNKKALAIGIGHGEKDALTDMLNAPAASGGTLSSSHVDGKLYLKWLAMMKKSIAKAQAKVAATHADDAKAKAKNEAAMARLKSNMEAMQAIFKQIKEVSAQARLTDNGLRITADSRLN
ncbi:MAG TPA: hypothetical protein VFK31_05005 [Rhodanobacteraceae bacterium]|nr:hypothetical protein [Rhodanobacteraceae bacterium]